MSRLTGPFGLGPALVTDGIAYVYVLPEVVALHTLDTLVATGPLDTLAAGALYAIIPGLARPVSATVVEDAYETDDPDVAWVEVTVTVPAGTEGVIAYDEIPYPSGPGIVVARTGYSETRAA